MPQVEINMVSILLAAVAAMVVGFIWYSPSVFGNEFMKLTGMKPKDMKKDAMGKLYGMQFLVSLVTAYVLAHIISYAGATTTMMGAQAGFWAWLGFAATTKVGSHLWSPKPTKLLWIDLGNQLVTYVAMGAVLVMWS